VGGATVLLEQVTPESLLSAIGQYRATMIWSSPVFYRQMAHIASKFDLSTAQQCVSAGEALPVSTRALWREATGIEIVDGIGSTEMLHIYCSNRFGDVRRGTSGRPVSGYELKLLDLDGNEPPAGEPGQLFVKGDSCAAYYWRQHEKTKRCMVGEWFATGDRYRVDEDGYYVYEGRMDDMLKVGGLWVSPTDMETTIMQHPGVREAVVIGVEVDEVSRIKVFVIPSGEADDALADDLRAWCKQRLRRYEYPHLVEFVDDFPRTVTGKVQRFKLRRREASR
jgi:benzoate-CoA ligase